MKKIVLWVGLMASGVSHAETISFEEVWSKVKQNSPVLSREEHHLRASELRVSRLNKHWLPSLSLGASVFSTNDPASNFFSNLSQRQVTTLDFNPTNLNQPGSNSFGTATLGLDLPLYEGGRKSAEFEVQSKFRDAQKFNHQSVLLNEYVELALDYAKIMSFTVAKDRLSQLSARVNELLSKYSIGSQSNPVGYSGLLGLRSLKNRVAGELLTVQSKEQSSKESLSQKMNRKEQDWTTESEEALKFLDRAVVPTKDEIPSLMELSLQSKSEALDAMKSAERSRFLPRIGLFANEGLTHGDRGTGTSFTGGVYLHWSLFNPESLNQVSEKEELHLASVSEVDSAKQSRSIARKTILQGESSMKQNLALLIESEGLLSEQVKVASRLFQSGSISALQLSEVLNRRVDLILNLMAVEEGLIDIRGKLMMLSRKDGTSL